MSLDSLPPEILTQILSSCSSRLDLHAAISASPACLHVFLASPGRIALPVLCRSTSAAVLPDAVAVLLAPTVTNKTLEDWKQSVRTFLDGYFSEHDDESKWQLDAGHGRAFLKLQGKVHRFIKDMTQEYFDLLYADNPEKYALGHAIHWYSEQPENKRRAFPSRHPLTMTEMARMERAFYRFELYCRCFPADPKRPGKYLLPAKEQSALFISRLLPWDVEEMSCVHQYFETSLDKLVTAWEEQIIAKMQEHEVKEPDRACHPPEALCSYQAGEINEPHGLDLYLCSSISYSQRHYNLCYTVSLGLDVLDSILFAANEKNQLDLVRSLTTMTWDFLHEAIKTTNRLMPESMTDEEDANHRKRQSDYERTHASGGWRRFRQNIPSNKYLRINGLRRSAHWTTRRLGYVFWDEPRWFNKEVEIKLNGASRQLPSLAVRPIAEQRLEGIQIPQRVMNEILHDYGITFDVLKDTHQLKREEA